MLLDGNLDPEDLRISIGLHVRFPEELTKEVEGVKGGFWRASHVEIRTAFSALFWDTFIEKKKGVILATIDI